MSKEDRRLAPWTVTSSQPALETPWFIIDKKRMETPSGAKPTYYIHHSNDSVMCVCVTRDKKVLLEKQYRPAVDKVSIDYPAGKLEDDDAKIEDAMLRELKEETGYTVTSFEKIAVIDKDPAFTTSKMHIYLAKGAAPGTHNQEETESIVSEFIPAKEVLRMALNGDIACAACVSATFHAFTKLGWLTTPLD